MAISNLNLASNKAIQLALSNLRLGYNTRNAWVDTTNRYIVNAASKVNDDLRTGSIVAQDLVDYIATSILIHCSNGWSYLSSAVNAYLEGDFGVAIHNAYYGELRAIMSLLASQGIGVFNTEHIIIDDAGNIHKAQCPFNERKTHSFAKGALEQWLMDPANQDVLLNQLIIEGKSLKDWFNATNFPPSTHLPGLVAADWIKSWSLDVSILEDETTFRNFVSYRPQHFNLNFTRPSDRIENRLTLVSEIWKICSPVSVGGTFDLSILRLSLELLFRKLMNVDIATFLDPVKDWGQIFNDLGLSPTSMRAGYIQQFLTRRIDPDDNILFDRAKDRYSVPILESDTDAAGIISRACLLLILTTKVTESLLKRTVTSKSDLLFWTNHIGLKQGYWDIGNPPYLFSDFWSDIQVELEDVEKWLGKAGIIHTNNTFRNGVGKNIQNVKHLDKAYLWTIMP